MLLTNQSTFIHSFVHSLVCSFVLPCLSVCVASSVLLIVALFAPLVIHFFVCSFVCLPKHGFVLTGCLPMGPLPLEAPMRAPSCRPSPQTNATNEEKHTNFL